MLAVCILTLGNSSAPSSECVSGVSDSYNNALIIKCVSAPINTSVMRLPMIGFDVSLRGYIGNPQVSSFIIDVKSGFINKTWCLSRYARPLVCFFTGLVPGSHYTIRAVACSSQHLGYSDTTKIATWTKPSCKAITSFIAYGFIKRDISCLGLQSALILSINNRRACSFPFICRGQNWTTRRKSSYTSLRSRYEKMVLLTLTDHSVFIFTKMRWYAFNALIFLPRHVKRNGGVGGLCLSAWRKTFVGDEQTHE